MSVASFTVNQFSLVDEKNAALKDLLTEFSWQEEALLQLSLPLLAMVEAVSSLEDAATLESFRANLITELKSIKQRGRERAISPALLDKLCFVWAAFFDERISYGCHLDTTQWQNKTLVSQLFGIRNSGDTFFSLVSQLMEFPKKHLALLKICYLILQLGFKGKYHNGRVAELKKLTADISFALSELNAFKLVANTDQTVHNASNSSRRFGLFTGFSPVSFWLVFMVLMIVGLVIYNKYFGDIYELQNQEYLNMADDTYEHIRQLQPKKMFIENAGFYDQQYSYEGVPEGGKTPSAATQIASEEIKTSTSASVEPSQAEHSQVETSEATATLNNAPTQYLVQVGAFQNLTRAERLQQRCNNARYPIVIKESGVNQYVGYLATGYAQAKEVSHYLAEICNVSAYIKEYQ